jgi:hypothetical protein
MKNNKTKNNKFISGFCLTLLCALAFVSCEEHGVLPLEIPTGISFNLESDAVQVQPGGSEYALQLQSTTASNSARTYTITMNEDASTGLPADYSISGTSITIPVGALLGSTIISFDYDAIPLGVTRKLVFDLDPITDGSFTNSTRTSISVNYTAFCPQNEVFLEFVFDDYPEEIYWVIEGSSGVFAESATPAGFDAYAGLSGGITEAFCMPDGTYTFTIFDKFSDGICCNYGNGSYSLTGGGNTYASGGSYGASESTTFTLGN